MRKYNFPVSFAPAAGDRFCRVVLHDRFASRELIDDFPKNITARYLNDVVGIGTTVATYREANETAIDIVVSQRTPISDIDRAIILNLIDFGQDYESSQSTTIKKVVFFLDNAQAMSVAQLLDALEGANIEAGLFMTARLAEFPPEDEYLATNWPQGWIGEQKYDWPGYYFFNFAMTYASALPQPDLDFAKQFIKASHDVNMWNGYNPGRSARQSVASDRAGMSFEIDAEGMVHLD
ncbi:hypothetical protein [Phyllobacterium sp. K27]